MGNPGKEGATGQMEIDPQCEDHYAPRIECAVKLDAKDIERLYRLNKDRSPGRLAWNRFISKPERREHWDKLVIDDQIMGFIHWGVLKDNSRVIYDILVHPEHRLKGYGRILVGHIGGPADCRSSHPFFEAIGFKDRKRHKEPAVVPEGEPWILTHSGKVVNPLNLQPQDIYIDDIAHHLACCNRFAGATLSPISVAQHSVYVSRLVIDEDEAPSKNRKLQLQALLHDAAEAYLGDVTKWLKATMPQYIEAEERAMTAIFKKFRCDPVIDERVWRADRVMVMYEGVKGFEKAWSGLHLAVKPGYEPITPQEMEKIGRWAPWNWRDSESAFLLRFRQCMPK